MNDDPIVREVRNARDELARKLNYDTEAIIADLMANQRALCSGHRLVKRVSETAESEETSLPMARLTERK